MTDSSMLYTIFYILMSACFIFPPSEFVSAGFTVQYIFSSWLGSESEYFIQYHIRRTVATILCHSFLPFGYLVGLSCLGHTDPRAVFWEGNTPWRLFVLSSVLVPITSVCIVCTWWKDGWKPHPIAKTLSAFCNRNTSWPTVASNINTEFRRINKICIDTNSVVRVIATDSWILKVTPYNVDIGHQSDTVLILISTDTHRVSPNSPGGAQFLNIEVKTLRNGLKPFNIRLNALDFRDLQDKVNRPITILTNVTFHRTMIDRFLDAFRDQVTENPFCDTAQELEPCMGCMQATSAVKLEKQCEDDSMRSSENCGHCYCRPMWCIDCMGKWFASRQDQDRPNTWLACKCTCPVCRSKFCILDVCPVRPAL